ncbi:C-X-C motif chemokine 13 [Pteropus alecto]|uniref:C-X-C motif chemokine 13 n=1 Tax=Pteropus alecto TaxID=9402 RepID=L5KZ61_PTEAL|nr:C-X-C motif chemokine 13 [Pteropus alecto]
MPTFTTPLQHCIGSLRHSSKTRKRNKRHLNWKERSVLEAFNTNLKCKCTETTSSKSVLKLLSKIVTVQFLPPGNGCPTQEIIVSLKNKSTICLNPKAKWVQSLLKIVRT